MYRALEEECSGLSCGGVMSVDTVSCLSVSHTRHLSFPTLTCSLLSAPSSAPLQLPFSTSLYSLSLHSHPLSVPLPIPTGKEFIDAQAILRSCGLGLFDLRVDSLIGLYKDRYAYVLVSDYFYNLVKPLKGLHTSSFSLQHKPLHYEQTGQARALPRLPHGHHRHQAETA